MGITLYIVVSTNRTRIQLPNPNVSLHCCSAVSLQRACTKTYTVAMQVFSPQRTDSLTWWPIKSKVQQPLLGFMVTFDINHWCPGSAVRFCPQDSSDHSLTLLSKTGLYINTSLGGHLLDMRSLLPEEKKISSSSNTAGGLFNSAPQSMSSKRAKPASGLFFFWRKGENCVDFGVSLVSLHHRSEGSSDFYRAYGWHFDFGSVLLTLMSTPAIFLTKKAVTRQGGMCNIYWISLTVDLCPERPLKYERLEWKWSITEAPKSTHLL